MNFFCLTHLSPCFVQSCDSGGLDTVVSVSIVAKMSIFPDLTVITPSLLTNTQCKTSLRTVNNGCDNSYGCDNKY